jgi:hypothetical protein
MPKGTIFLAAALSLSSCSNLTKRCSLAISAKFADYEYIPVYKVFKVEEFRLCGMGGCKGLI